MKFLKRLLRSKTIKGALVMLAGYFVEHSKEILTPELLAQYGVYIKAASILLGAGGFGGVVYGRTKATGPITKQKPEKGKK